MAQSPISLAVIAAISAATLGSAQAHVTPPADTEQCVPVNQKGENLIKAGHSDCGTGKSVCAGQNAANEKDAWIVVPKGMCEQINTGNWQEVPQSICAKLEGVDTTACKK